MLVTYNNCYCTVFHTVWTRHIIALLFLINKCERKGDYISVHYLKFRYIFVLYLLSRRSRISFVIAFIIPDETDKFKNIEIF